MRLFLIALRFQQRDLARHFERERFVVRFQRLDRIAFVLGDLHARGLQLARSELLLGHDLGQRFLGLVQIVVRVADFLIEDAQRLAVGDGLARFMCSTAQRGHQLVPNGHDELLLLWVV